LTDFLNFLQYDAITPPQTLRYTTLSNVSVSQFFESKAGIVA